jgi:predicted nuclease of predicted toxin-antitoxin system
MRLFADESIDGPIIRQLRRDGHNIIYVKEIRPGISDEEVLALANHELAIILTEDKDFGELVFRRGLFTYGVILARLQGLSPNEKAKRISEAIQNNQHNLWNKFVVITEDKIRIR